MANFAHQQGEELNILDVPPRRDFRRVFKPRLPRKITSSARINLNRFWNELEDFYSRYDDRRAKNNNNSQSIIIPPYTTDTFDHRREEAENRLNEQLEMEEMRRSKLETSKPAKIPLPPKTLNLSSRSRLQSYEVFDEDEYIYSSSEDDETSSSSRSSSPTSVALWNVLETTSDKLPSPPPPRSLVSLVSLMVAKEEEDL